MGKNLKFVNEKHEKNYISLINKFVSKINKYIDVVLKLISIDEVYNIAKEYIKGTTIEFKELLNDSRMTNTALFIGELAYSFLIKKFAVKSISSTRNLDTDTRNFIINLLDSYATLDKQKISCA